MHTHARTLGRFAGLIILSVIFLSPCAKAGGDTAPASVTLSPDPSTLLIEAGGDTARGYLLVTPNGLTLDEITLRAIPLALGDNHALVRFPDNGGKDLIRLSDPALKCKPDSPCSVLYEVYGAWGNGTYQGSIEAYTSRGKITTAPIAALRPVSVFRPIVTSDAIHDGRIVFDASNTDNFLLTIQNPMGSPPRELLLTNHQADGSACSAPDTAFASDSIDFAPRKFRLEPGETQTVIATVTNSIGNGTHPGVLRIISCETPASWTDMVVSVAKYERTAGWLLFFVILGSAASVLLNNIFPVSRTKQALRSDLRRLDEVLHDSPNAGPALLDALSAEGKRLKLMLHRIHFYDPAKGTTIEDAKNAVKKFADSATLTQRVSFMRSKLDSATISIRTHALIREMLREAEEAVLGGDLTAATDRLTEALAKLTDAAKDVEEAALKQTLSLSINKLMKERGVLTAVSATVPPGSAQTAPGAASPSPELRQPAERNPRIRALVEQLHRDFDTFNDLAADEILDVEHDFFIANIWTEHVEPRLADDPDRLRPLSEAILEALLRNPKSQHLQLLLDLLRSDTTPEEIAERLRKGAAQVECDPRPKYLESVDIAFAFTDPLLADVPAARRLLSYRWEIDDGTAPPPDVDRCKHYFRAPTGWTRSAGGSGARVGWRFWEGRRTGEAFFTVKVAVTVPFAANKGPYEFSREVRPRRGERVTWTAMPMELASFAVTTAIAVVTAFGAHYGSGFPNVIGWSDALSSFMFGFGLDQLRNTVAPPAAPITTTPAPQPQAAAAAAPHG